MSKKFELRSSLTRRMFLLRYLRSFRQAMAKKDEATIKVLAAQIPPQELAPLLGSLPSDIHPLVFSAVSARDAGEIIRHLSEEERKEVFQSLGTEKISPIVEALPPDEQVDFLQSLEEQDRTELLNALPEETARSITELARYRKDTAGGLMSPQVVTVHRTMSCQQAIDAIRHQASAESIFYVYVVDDERRLCGVLEIRKLLTHPPDKIVKDLMNPDVVSVEPEVDQEEVVRIFQRYDLLALPVVDSERRILGVITADDAMEVMEDELDEDIFKMVGSEAEELEKKDPLAIARMRLPWLLVTLGIELFAGIIVHFYNETLSQIILLASFMPIISALSGNVGMQAAAIVIRGLATGHVKASEWKKVLVRELLVDIAMAIVVALALGLVASLWSQKLEFGIVVGLSLALAMLTAGIFGTFFPLLSQRSGFDPAASAGPFASAFQDVVGFFVFLSISTLLLQWMR